MLVQFNNERRLLYGVVAQPVDEEWTATAAGDAQP